VINMDKKDKHLAYILQTPVYYVGGCIRDSLIGIEAKDHDLCCELSQDDVKKRLESTKYHDFTANIVDGSRFLVCIIKSKEGYHKELAQFRIDKGDHAIATRSMEEDALRRDFTINSLYRDVTTGNVFDPTGKGVSDIIDKKIRFIGKPEDRIKEDPIRVYRGYRLLSKLKPYGFSFENKTLKAIRETFNDSTKSLPPERIRCEIEKMVIG